MATKRIRRKEKPPLPDKKTYLRLPYQDTAYELTDEKQWITLREDLLFLQDSDLAKREKDNTLGTRLYLAEGTNFVQWHRKVDEKLYPVGQIMEIGRSRYVS
jgi:hypothetical protein